LKLGMNGVKIANKNFKRKKYSWLFSLRSTF
jgi:hypothetical protein